MHSSLASLIISLYKRCKLFPLPYTCRTPYLYYYSTIYSHLRSPLIIFQAGSIPSSLHQRFTVTSLNSFRRVMIQISSRSKSLARSSLADWPGRVSTMFSCIVNCASQDSNLQMIQPTISADVDIRNISCLQAFNLLNKEERLYAYHFSQACIIGSAICLFQSSFESPALYVVNQHAFQRPIQDLHNIFLSLGSQEEWKKFLVYTASFYANLDTHKSFGDTKFVPGVPKELLDSFYKQVLSQQIFKVWSRISSLVYSFQGKFQKIGREDKGISGYYSQTLTAEQGQLADKYLASKSISPINTHVYKQGSTITIWICSIDKKELAKQQFQGRQFIIRKGLFSSILQKVNVQLRSALKYAKGEHQIHYIESLIKHFQHGHMEDHKESQRAWVKDIGPVIQTTLGHTQTYKDPRGVRGSFQGMMSISHKQLSKKLIQLVNHADFLMKERMPWPAEYEKDKFLKPDFVYLNVVTFASHGTPMGINLPNYDDVRQNIGFKNVYLGNSIVAPKKVVYFQPDDAQLYIKYFMNTSFHGTAYHQLMGHGCGKMFMEQENGTKNFDPAMIDLYTGKPVTYYKHGQTWNSVFKHLSNPIEECRAQSVALYFGLFSQTILMLQPQLKGVEDQITRTVILNFMRAGIQSMAYYDINEKKWLQAHMFGRFILFRIMKQVGIIEVNIVKDEQDHQDTFSLKVNIQKLPELRISLGQFLKRTNCYKATANFNDAEKYFTEISTLDQQYLSYRVILMKRRKERALQTQGKIFLKQGEVHYEEGERSLQGVIRWRKDMLDSNQILKIWSQFSQIKRPD